LSEHLDEKQIKFIPKVDGHCPNYGDHTNKLLELISASKIGIAFLRSLESSLDMELRQKEAEIRQKEKEISTLKKTYEQVIEAVSQLPEVQRSKAVAEWKKAHRDIEEFSKLKKP